MKKSSDMLEGLKKPKNGVFRVLVKVLSDMLFLLSKYESVKILLNFFKGNMFGKNLVLELSFKNIKTNQNAEFVKLQYFPNKLRYEVKVLDVTRGP